MDIRGTFRENPVLAILRNIPAKQAVPYAQAAYEGGIRLFEVAMNSEDGLEQLRTLRRHFEGLARVGAVTVTTVELAKAALDAGAMFLLAPSCPLEMLCYCRDNRIAFLPGVFTPSEAGLCLAHGFDTLKLFPAGDLPLSYVKSLKGPLDGSEYVAIGGVTPDNAHDFIKAGYLGVGLGSNLFPAEAVKHSDWAKAAERVRSMCAGLAKPAA